MREEYSDRCKTCKKDLFAEKGNGFQQLTSYAKNSILDVCQSSEILNYLSLGSHKVFLRQGKLSQMSLPALYNASEVALIYFWEYK